MRMIRRFFALLLCFLLCASFAFAQDTADLDALARQLAQKEIDALLTDASGWVKIMLADAQLGEVTQNKNSVTILLTVPALQSDLRAAVPVDDPAAYLKEAFASYLSHENRQELKLNFTYTEKDGEILTKWSGVSNPRNLLSKLKSLAGKAKKSYTVKNMKAALNAYLLPKAADMPKRQPETLPELSSIANYAAQVGGALGLTAEQAEGRLRCLLLMMNLTDVDTSDPLESTVLSVKVDDWKSMLRFAVTKAKGLMDSAAGVPDMTRLELEHFLWDALPEACMPLLYDKTGTEEIQLTVDLAAAVKDGPQQAAALMDYFSGYSAQVETALDELSAYAATLPWYPRVAPISAGVLSGAEAEKGALVTFDLGNDKENGGFVRVMQSGAQVLTGYIREQVRLTVKLAPGSYTVYYTAGPEWFGEKYLFGKEAAFGKFDMTVPSDGRLVIHMSKGSGKLAVTELTSEEFEEGK